MEHIHYLDFHLWPLVMSAGPLFISLLHFVIAKYVTLGHLPRTYPTVDMATNCILKYRVLLSHTHHRPMVFVRVFVYTPSAISYIRVSRTRSWPFVPLESSVVNVGKVFCESVFWCAEARAVGSPQVGSQQSWQQRKQWRSEWGLQRRWNAVPRGISHILTALES